MKGLITGGAGFIGSHLAEALLRNGEEVYIIDNLSTGSIEHIEHLKGNPRFHYTIDTIKNEPLLTELIDRCDLVYHLAAAVGVKLIVEHPVDTIETNIYGTELVLKIANKKKKKVIITSTSEVYGKNETVPFKEEDNMVLGCTKNSRWSYACSKAIDEFLALAYFREKRLPVVILRLFNTIGPRQTGRYGMVVPTFVKQALMGKSITIYGDGKQSRSFSYVGDVVKGMIDIANNPEAVGEVFNIGNDKEITIEELARLVKNMTASTSNIIYIPYSEAYEEGFEDMRRRVPDLTKIKKMIGYQPSMNIKDTIKCVIDYFANNTNSL